MVGKTRRWAGAAVPLLAFVLLFRLLIPTGYMIAPGDAGRPGLVLCGAAAGGAVAHGSHHGHDGHRLPAKSDELPCPYAAMSAPPLPPAAPALAPPAPFPVAPLASTPIHSSWRAAPAAPPPPATGPPLPV